MSYPRILQRCDFFMISLSKSYSCEKRFCKKRSMEKINGILTLVSNKDQRVKVQFSTDFFFLVSICTCQHEPGVERCNFVSLFGTLRLDMPGYNQHSTTLKSHLSLATFSMQKNL